jgi:hypothetical protein
MAGSLKTVEYVDDAGISRCIKVDESNIEMIMGTQIPASGAFDPLLQGMTARFVRVESQDGLIKRTIPVLTQARFNALNGTTPLVLASVDSDVGIEVRVRTKVAEKRRFIPRSYDTGRLDGDPN